MDIPEDLIIKQEKLLDSSVSVVRDARKLLEDVQNLNILIAETKIEFNKLWCEIKENE